MRTDATLFDEGPWVGLRGRTDPGKRESVAVQRNEPSGSAAVPTIDAAGFDEFFAAERGDLLRFCWGLTGDREDARDVAQETMARAWREWDRISGPDSRPAAWIRTVALNLVRGGWRRAQTAAAGLVELGTALHGAGGGRSSDTHADVDLERALRALPERQREAVVLHHLLDLPVAECADVMGVGASTVKIHLRRGRAALAKALEVHGETGEPTGPDATEVP